MRLPETWERFLGSAWDIESFYRDLKRFLNSFETVLPQRELIFNAFHKVSPDEASCVIYGEDPYPRQTSANGIAFWDAEISSWQMRTNGSALKNILKALLIAKEKADYYTTISECREIAAREKIPAPPRLFEKWLSQGVLLINTSMTFSGASHKKAHFAFWQPFHQALIRALNKRPPSPYYIVWGRKAQQWEPEILQSIDSKEKIIKNGHPTFVHQFLDKSHPEFSPFTEIMTKTDIHWI